MLESAWVKEFDGAVTVCDREGVILEMNDRAAEVFAGDGGRALVGTNALDCHPERARAITINGHRKSFHDPINVNIARVMRIGLLKGRIIER